MNLSNFAELYNGKMADHLTVTRSSLGPRQVLYRIFELANFFRLYERIIIQMLFNKKGCQCVILFLTQ